ncbi:hypothetical protein [Glaciecola sp. KUL10]|uniref:hypothetical protein n=1 Tax=Glaciecola sp. (strain KUL10) TaxID=2161813 RepID=UPI000D788964|nr:hypothetical protein [Glaciecola sp. KUL10]GBL05945.1 cell wall surface anchor protein [Glaciecola sp. KUL10]
MGYYTTVRAVNSSGKCVKAEISISGKSKGFTNTDTGELSFDLSSNSTYEVSAKQFGSKGYGKVKGGSTTTIRIP